MFHLIHFSSFCTSLFPFRGASNSPWCGPIGSSAHLMIPS